MNAIMKLTAVTLGALSIAGGAAVAQSTSNADANANPDTANYGTPPGAPLKRDGSLSSDRNGATPMNGSATTDTSSTNTSTSTQNTDANSSMSNTAAPVNGTNSSLQPRADRN